MKRFLLLAAMGIASVCATARTTNVIPSTRTGGDFTPIAMNGLDEEVMNILHDEAVNAAHPSQEHE